MWHILAKQENDGATDSAEHFSNTSRYHRKPKECRTIINPPNRHPKFLRYWQTLFNVTTLPPIVKLHLLYINGYKTHTLWRRAYAGSKRTRPNNIINSVDKTIFYVIFILYLFVEQTRRFTKEKCAVQNIFGDTDVNRCFWIIPHFW